MKIQSLALAGVVVASCSSPVSPTVSLTAEKPNENSMAIRGVSNNTSPNSNTSNGTNGNNPSKQQLLNVRFCLVNQSNNRPIGRGEVTIGDNFYGYTDLNSGCITLSVVQGQTYEFVLYHGEYVQQNRTFIFNDDKQVTVAMISLR